MESFDSQDTPVSKKPYAYPGGILHRGLFQLLKEQKITATELLLLCVIDGFIQYGKHTCSAYNTYLGNAIGKSKKYVSDCIAKLSSPELKLIKITYVNGVRYLETALSRIPTEREQMERTSHPEKSGPPSGKIRTPHPEKSGIHSEEKRKDKKREEGDSRKQAFAPPSPLISDNHSEKETAQEESPHLRSAKKLKETLQSAGIQFTGKLTDTVNAFRLLKEQDKINYLPILKGYCSACKRGELDDFGFPTVSNGKQFRQHYNWIASKVKIFNKASPSRSYDDEERPEGIPPEYELSHQGVWEYRDEEGIIHQIPRRS